MRLIDADQFGVVSFQGKSEDFSEGVAFILDKIYEAPTIEERPSGEWIRDVAWTTGVGMGEQYGWYYKCSECGYKVKGGYTDCGIKFCQECGSDNRPKEG